MKLLFSVIVFSLLVACESGFSKTFEKDSENIDSCSNAVIYPNAKFTEQMVESDFSGELNNYWGEDTTKLDFKHVFKDGNLVESCFYFENGKIQEKYIFKCQSLHGNIEFYHKNGQIGKVIPYEYGRRNGVGIQYDSLGVETARVHFKNDSIIENSHTKD